MCIRDRISPSDIEEYLFYLKYYEKDGVVHTNDERGIKRIPVSYTHLDVYKRQV